MALYDALYGPGEPVDDDREQLVRRTTAFEQATYDFDQAVEPIVGRCSCGGQFALNAPVRCPVCKSSNIKEGDITMHYD